MSRFSSNAFAVLLFTLPVAALAQPTITGVANNYSYIPVGFPNSGIAPGTIFLIYGSGMSTAPANLVLQSSAAPGLPTTLEGATLSVTVGGTTVTPAMYYATPGQIAAVLPSATPTGTASLTVTYNGVASAPFQFQVVPYALGLNTFAGTGSGLILATDTSGNKITYTNSAKPGETILMYGSGLGANTAVSDTLFTSGAHPVSTPLQIYFGGVPATILYAGSSGYPGYNQLNVTIPDKAPTDCYVSVVGVTGTGSSAIASNFGSLAISPSGGECTNSIFGISGTTVSTLTGESTLSFGDLFVGQLISPTSPTNNTPQTRNFGSADFIKETGASFSSSSSSSFSLGSCSVSEIISLSGTFSFPSGLNAGTLTVTSPTGGTTTFMAYTTGYYEASLPSNAITSSGGAYTVSATGATVGSFNTTINLPNPLLDWTNQSASATIDRAQGAHVTWTGGGSGTYVIISGSSSDSATGATGSFTCVTNQSALSFTVPAYITLTMPPGTGTLNVENVASFERFSASGLDFGIGFGFTGTEINSTYQ